MSLLAIASILILSLAPLAAADTYTVLPDGSGDYPTIQAAVSAAVDGDIIELGDGVFRGDGNRNVWVYDKTITIRSQSGDPAHCIIDPEGGDDVARRAIGFQATPSGTSLENVMIQNGSAPGDYGGAIEMYQGASPQITGCHFRANRASRGGAVFLFEDCVPTFTDCRFWDNTATDYAGAAMCALPGASATFTGCAFVNNTAGGSGGAFASWNSNRPILISCTFAGNDAPDGSGIATRWGSLPSLERCIIASGVAGEAIYCETITDVPTVACSDIYGNAGGDWVGCIEGLFGISGNIDADPLFCDAPGLDFSLQEASPCAAFSQPNEECDLIGAYPVGCASTTHACCIWDACQIMTEEGCLAAGGTWLSSPPIDTCDPNSCAVPVRETSWGALKVLYR